MKTILTFIMTLSSFALMAQNLLNNPGFEDGTSKWASAGADFEIIGQTLAGDSAAQLTVADSKYNGIRTNDTKIELVPGTYTATFWVKAANATTVGKKASIKVESTIGSGLSESASVILSATEWLQVKKEFTVSTTDSVKLMVRANNADAGGMVMYVDNVELVQKKENVLDGSFDIFQLSLNWTKASTATYYKTYATDSVHSGLNACVLTVNAANDFIKNKTALPLESGAGDYTVSVWVKGIAGEPCQLKAMIVNDGTTSNKVNNYIIGSTGVWEKIELSFSMTDANGTIQSIFRQITFDTPTTFAIDDFEIEKQIPTTVDETVQTSLVLYPNPASDIISLKGLEMGANVTIYNISGSKMMQNIYDGNAINVSSLSQGVYYLKTASEVSRFIIE